MSDQQSRLILSVLMLIVALTLLLAAMGVLEPDQTHTLLALSTDGNGLNNQPASAPADPHDPADTSPDGQASPDNHAATAELPVDLSIPATAGPGRLDLWPTESAIPSLRTIDLSPYQNRPYENLPLTGIIVFLDPGHGGSDSGATYPAHATNPELTEAEINLSVAQKTRDALEKLGATVYMIREDDRWQSIFYRIAFASRMVLNQFSEEMTALGYAVDTLEPLGLRMDEIMTANNDFESTGGRGIMNGVGAVPDLKLLLDIEYQFPEVLFLSIHCNALEDNDPTGGLQVYYLSGESAYQDENALAENQSVQNAPPVYQMYRDTDREKLARLIKTKLLSAVPQLEYIGGPDIINQNFAVLRELNVTSVLIELGFISSPIDRPILKSSERQSQMASAIADSVYAFYCSPD